MTAPFRIRRPNKGVQLLEAKSDENFKFYLDRLLKLIPAEVVTLYMVGSGFIPKNEGVVLIIWTIICLFGVVLLRAYGTADRRNNEPPDWIHVFLSSVAFVIWVYTLGGPFTVFNLAIPWVGSLLVLAWTFFVPIFYKGPS